MKNALNIYEKELEGIREAGTYNNPPKRPYRHHQGQQCVEYVRQ